MSPQQANITALSVPAGPRNDAAFVSSTTAPPTLVFRPGVTFPNNGPVNGNVYTTGNSSGTDGLTLLQNVLNGAGLAPARPFPSAIVELDFSNIAGDTFTLTGNLSFPANTVLKGIINNSSGVIPTIITGGFTITGVVELDDVAIEVTVAEATSVTGFGSFVMRGHSSLSSGDGNVFAALTTDATVYAYDFAALEPTIFSVSGATLVLYMEGASSTLAAGAVTLIGISSLNISLDSTGAFIDNSYYNTSGVEVFIGFTPPNIVTFAPGGTATQTVFTNQDELTGYISSVSDVDEIDGWIVQLDFSNVGDSYTLTDDATFTPNTVLKGLVNQTNGVFPTLVSDGSQVSGVIGFVDMLVSVTNATPFIGDTQSFLRAENVTITTDGSALFYVPMGTVTYDLYDTTIGDGTNAVLGAAAGTTLNLFDGTVIEALSLGTSPFEQTFVLNVFGSSAFIDPSFYDTTVYTATTIVFFYTPAPVVTFAPGGTAERTVFTDQTQLAGYLASVGSVVQEWTVLLDFSAVGDSYSLTDNLAFPANTTLQGVNNASTTGAYPTLISNGFWVEGIVTIKDALISVTNSVDFIHDSPIVVTLRNVTITSDGSAYFYTIIVLANIYLYDLSVLGDGTNSVINVPVGSLHQHNELIVYAAGPITIMANALLLGEPLASIDLFLYDSAAAIDPTYYTNYTSGIYIEFFFTPSSITTFQPGGTNRQFSVFTDFEELLGYIAAVGSLVSEWTIYLDGAFTSGVCTFLGTAAWPSNVTLAGVSNHGQSIVSLYLGDNTNAANDAVASPPPASLTIQGVAVSDFNVTSPWMPISGQSFTLILENETEIFSENNTQDSMFSLIDTSALTAILRDFSYISLDGAGKSPLISFDATSSGDFQLYDFATVLAGTLSISAAETVTAELSAEAFLDPAASVTAHQPTVTYEAVATQVSYTPSASGDWSGSPTTVQQALDRIAAVVSNGGISPIP